MKILFFLLPFALLSCTQNDAKQKELELRERELAVKEKELALKQNDSLANKTVINNTIVVPTAEAQKDSAANNKTLPTDKEMLTLISPTFYFGDIGHLSFKDFTTRKEKEYEWVGDIPAIDEIIKKCEGHEGCPALKGQVYSATLQFKLMDIGEWNGEEMKPTGKKEKRWVITALQKIKTP